MVDRGFLYRITSPSGKQYIGITSMKSVKARWKEHVYTAYNRNSSTVFSAAIRKYGKESFKIEVLLEAPWSVLNLLEPVAIDQFSTQHPNGYNLMTGGNQPRHSSRSKNLLAESAMGRVVSEKTRKKMSDAQRGRKQRPEVVAARAEKMRGRKRSAESRKRMSIAHKGTVFSDSHRKNISEAIKLHWLKRKKEV